MSLNDRRSGKDRRKEKRDTLDRRKNKDRRLNSDRRVQTERRTQADRRTISTDYSNKATDIQFEKSFDDQVEGRNAVLELLESGKDINKIYITKGERKGSINKIIAIANEKRIIIVEKDKAQMDMMAGTENYQGIIAIVPPYEYVEVEDILNASKGKNKDPFILILDGIEDTHNLGAIIRTAEAAGVDGIIIPKRRAASVNSTVSKVACGALEYMKIARVNNINDAIKKLKDNGVWICGTSLDAEKYYYDQDLTGPLAIVIGNEANGISNLVKKNCDFLVKIPMIGKVQSLNASVSTGIVIYGALRKR